MKISILLLLISVNALAAVDVDKTNGVQVSCIEFGDCTLFGDCDYKVCEIKVLKNEIRSCSFVVKPERNKAASSTVDCAIYDEVRSNQK